MAAVIHTIGTRVWIQDEEEGWLKAEVIKVENSGIWIRTEKNREIKCKPEEIPLQNLDSSGVEDMTRLPYLNEPAVLWNLKCRYKRDDIYTYTGTILIAVNPFASLDHLYGTYMMEQYRVAELGELSPHVYAIANEAFKKMCKEWKGQSILVSGESGAGKTETSKLLMKYLAYMGGYTDGGQAPRTGRSVEEQVLESNPLLEAFGNARTVRNNNSSRFGKYVEINFNKKGVISGAAIRTYLLERSRVVSINNPERNYHIFYQVCDGANEEQRKRWHLRPAKEFFYLNQSTCFQLPGVDNAEEFQITLSAMSKVGIPVSDQESILRSVAAVLHMGNISFRNKEEEKAEVVEASESSLAACADLLGVDTEGLRRALTTRTRQTHDGAIVSPLNAKAATETRDALAKVLYSKIFDLLVTRINLAIGEDKHCASSIGVLDIYGFESFAVNDFEQFCINLANEKLQQHFNQHVFKMEQAEYEREKIDWSYIAFEDNQDVLDLIEGNMGILSLLDEKCRFPTSTGKEFAERLYTSDLCKASARFSKPKTSVTAFTIDHYAGAVTYETHNFLDKNKDYVIAEHQSLMATSVHEFIRELFAEPADESAANDKPAARGANFKAFKFNSVGSQFKKQLGKLMTQLHTMEPHYIRCIKPNGACKPALFENKNALHQLRCGGVLEAVRISCAGFPSKRPYADFVDHFWPLAPELLKSNDDDREITRRIMTLSGLSGFQMGATKVFLRAGQMAQLDKLRTDKLNAAAITIQRHIKGWLARVKYARTLKSALVIQVSTRAMFARRLHQKLREEEAAIVLQVYWRRFVAQRAANFAMRVVLHIQAMRRATDAQNLFTEMRREAASVIIQKQWRRHAAETSLQDARAAALSFQCAYRCKLAVRELRALRAQQREAGKLLADKQMLERKVAEMSGTLELVQRQRGELKAELKEEKVRMEEFRLRLRDVENERDQAVAALGTMSAAKADALEAENAELRQALEIAKTEAAAAAEKALHDRAELERVHKSAQEYIFRLTNERSDLEKRFYSMKEDLITRLQNACSQRDEARGQLLERDHEIGKLKEEIDRLRVIEAAAAAAASAAATQKLELAGPATPSQIDGRDANSFSRAPGLLQNALRPGRDMYTTALQHVGSLMGSTPSLGAPSASAPAQAPRLDPSKGMDELKMKQAALAAEKRRLEEEKLLGALATPLGFQGDRPVAAITIFRCCLQWRTFQADRTTFFDRIVQVMASQIEQQAEDNAMLAYWLTNCVTLLHLLHKNIKPAGGSPANRPKAAISARNMLGGLFGRPAGVSGTVNHGEASIRDGGVGGFKQVEAKYPALLFKQQLESLIQRIFPMVRDNVKRQILPLLADCIIQRKVAARSTSMRRGTVESAFASATSPSGPRPWSDVLTELEKVLSTLLDMHVPKALVQSLFRQLFSFINVQLFNQLLLRRECCSFSNGEYVKTGLSQVEIWIQSAPPECIGDAWAELKYIRQAVTFLVIQKRKKTLEDITTDLCPVLSYQQLYRISTMYWDDKYNTETVSEEVLTQMKQRMVENSQSASHSFLLDEDASTAFAPAEVLSAVEDKDLYGAIIVPGALKEGESVGGFGFLEKELRLSQITPA